MSIRSVCREMEEEQGNMSLEAGMGQDEARIGMKVFWKMSHKNLKCHVMSHFKANFGEKSLQSEVIGLHCL